MQFPEKCRKSVFLDEGQHLRFPLFVTFPEFETSDYIDGAPENDSIGEHLRELIGEALPYDKLKLYNCESIEAYIELNATKPTKRLRASLQ